MSADMQLARKWRSRTFQSICGQSLVVRILQNNLYRGYFFPVYLFAGPRGSGKTSTARIFAAATNCQELSAFQQEPHRVTVPCHTCASCTSMFSGSHPDVVEIDAASYTGVDNVRSIIDSASFLPVMGRKKVYIIDEAHMLSKAACNAFLKILEEPPEGAIFILATTDADKILPTVQSRTLQIYFTHVHERTVQQHITQVCDAEGIPYDDAGLARIAQAADGSIRDALQLLERVYLAHERISRDAVITTLGALDEQTVLDILGTLARDDMATAMTYVKSLELDHYTPMRVWHHMLEGVRALFWGNFGSAQTVWHNLSNFYHVVHQYDETTLHAMLEVMYQYEPYMLKTTHGRGMCEMLLYALKRCIDTKARVPGSGNQRNSIDQQSSASQHAPSSSESVAQSPSTDGATSVDANDLWSRTMEQFQQKEDPLLASILTQAQHVVWQNNDTLHVTFARELQLYYDWMCHHIPTLQRIVQQLVQYTPHITFTFSQSSQQPSSPSRNNERSQQAKSSPQQRSSQARTDHADAASSAKKKRVAHEGQQRSAVVYEQVPHINDTETWPFANAVLQAFPGSIKRIKKR